MARTCDAPLWMVVLAVAGCGGDAAPDPDCGDGTLVAVDREPFCVYSMAVPGRVCPPEAPNQVFIQTVFPDWAAACTTREPSADGTVVLPGPVCEAAENGRAPCTWTAAADGEGVCCPYSPTCSIGAHGAWAPTSEACIGGSARDGRFYSEVDDWGCTYLQGGGLCADGSMCCGP